MDLKETNAIVAHYFEELTFRASKVGYKITNAELANALGYKEHSVISKWIRGNYDFTKEKLNEVMIFIGRKEQFVSSREIVDSLRKLIDFLENR